MMPPVGFFERGAYLIFGEPRLKCIAERDYPTFEAGMSLLGTEVKSIRAGKIQLKDSYIEIREGEAVLVGAHVSPYLQGNRDFVSEFLAKRMPSVGYVPPEATFFAWLNCKELDLPGGPYEYFLEHAKVGLSDGVPFGEAGKDHVRVNIATSRELLGQTMERLAGSIEK